MSTTRARELGEGVRHDDEWLFRVTEGRGAVARGIGARIDGLGAGRRFGWGASGHDAQMLTDISMVEYRC
jgi:hypothetical protein